ncbi:MAG: AbrB family transcriptional regulator [Boseongicola sp.]|nr:MAG: AbrB family transcriptional regulator [Boseongicola sp.]
MATVSFNKVGRQTLAVFIGLIGAIVGTLVGLPLPWMLGSMILVTLASLASAPLLPPVTLRSLLLPILGIMLGAGFHADTFEKIAQWTTTLLIMPFFVMAAFSGAFVFYRNLGKFDLVTAYFSSAPGGLNDMMILGGAAGGDERRIALAHASRILIVVCLISLFFGAILDVSTDATQRNYITFSSVPMMDLSILMACAVVGSLAGPYLGLPAPQLLGPMILSAIVHLTGITDAPPPTMAVNAAQLVMGTVVGTRFLGVPIIIVAREIRLAVGATCSMLLATIIASVCVTWLTDIDIFETLLAFSPGGLPEMSLLSLAIGADVAFVVTIHIFRIILVIVAAPLAFRLLSKS